MLPCCCASCCQCLSWAYCSSPVHSSGAKHIRPCLSSVVVFVGLGEDLSMTLKLGWMSPGFEEWQGLWMMSTWMDGGKSAAFVLFCFVPCHLEVRTFLCLTFSNDCIFRVKGGIFWGFSLIAVPDCFWIIQAKSTLLCRWCSAKNKQFLSKAVR